MGKSPTSGLRRTRSVAFSIGGMEMVIRYITEFTVMVILFRPYVVRILECLNIYREECRTDASIGLYTSGRVLRTGSRLLPSPTASSHRTAPPTNDLCRLIFKMRGSSALRCRSFLLLYLILNELDDS